MLFYDCECQNETCTDVVCQSCYGSIRCDECNVFTSPECEFGVEECDTCKRKLCVECEAKFEGLMIEACSDCDKFYCNQCANFSECESCSESICDNCGSEGTCGNCRKVYCKSHQASCERTGCCEQLFCNMECYEMANNYEPSKCCVAYSDLGEDSFSGSTDDDDGI